MADHDDDDGHDPTTATRPTTATMTGHAPSQACKQPVKSQSVCGCDWLKEVIGRPSFSFRLRSPLPKLRSGLLIATIQHTVSNFEPLVTD